MWVRARALHCSSPFSFPWILAWKPETPMLLSLGGRCFNSVIALYSRYSWSIESLSAGGSKSAGKSKSKKILKLEILTYGGVASERDFWNYWQFSCTKQSKVFIDWYWQFTLFYRKDNQELRPLDAKLIKYYFKSEASIDIHQNSQILVQMQRGKSPLNWFLFGQIHLAIEYLNNTTFGSISARAYSLNKSFNCSIWSGKGWTICICIAIIQSCFSSDLIVFTHETRFRR